MRPKHLKEWLNETENLSDPITLSYLKVPLVLLILDAKMFNSDGKLVSRRKMLVSLDQITFLRSLVTWYMESNG